MSLKDFSEMTIEEIAAEATQNLRAMRQRLSEDDWEASRKLAIAMLREHHDTDELPEGIDDMAINQIGAMGLAGSYVELEKDNSTPEARPH